VTWLSLGDAQTVNRC